MTPTPEDLAGAVLTIDLVALKENWRRLKARAGQAECGAAVKGNAYGLGIEPVARALWEAGCRSFFVARPKEGEELRAILPEATIYVLDGLFAGQAEFYAKLNLCPALISIEEAREWAAFGRVYGRKLPCAIHVDTGINRLGFSLAEFDALLADSFTMEGLNVTLLMSHLACADDPPHPLNQRQRGGLPGGPGEASGRCRRASPIRAASSWAMASPMIWCVRASRCMAEIRRRMLRIRCCRRHSGRCRDATARALPPATRWATARPGRRPARPASPSSAPATRTACRAPSPPASRTGPAQVFINGRRCPVIGRVSMDMMAIDVTDLPEGSVTRGTRAEILGRQHRHRRGGQLGGHHIL